MKDPCFCPLCQHKLIEICKLCQLRINKPPSRFKPREEIEQQYNSLTPDNRIIIELLLDIREILRAIWHYP